MKYVLLIFVIISIISCGKKQVEKELCFMTLKYKTNESPIEPALIKVSVIDNQSVIEKSMKNEQFKQVLFYSIKEDQKIGFYMKKNSYEKREDTIILYLGTSYFSANKDRKWESKEVEDYLTQKGIGLVIGKDTIRMDKCN
ncbi:hypothetical protein [Flavobacterium sp. '19STA2R22 D10 B1']|uniref:hypothetical protein n=1 Tax=Flavobacterium aerium TaxID=3037261 RepID=UPI00278C0EC0|nr:hypothetical protein [Flavobacterium sp. '19STA2R22 D10 B1']